MSPWSYLKKFFERAGPLWRYTLLQFCVARAGDVVNFYIGAFLIPAMLPRAQLGAVLPLISLAALVTLPLTIIFQSSVKFFNVFSVSGRYGKAKRLLRDLIGLSLAFSVVMAIVLWVARDFVAVRLKLADHRILLMVAVLSAVTCLRSVVVFAAQGLKRFGAVVAQTGVEPAVKVVAVLLLLRQFQVVGLLMAHACAILTASVVAGITLWVFLRRKGDAEAYRSHLPEMSRYLLPMAVMVVGTVLQASMEPWIIRHRLSTADSGGYYIAAMMGMIPGYVVPAILPFFFPLISERHERGRSTHGMLLGVMACVLLFGMIIALSLGAIGGTVLNLRHAWRLHAGYAPFIGILGVMAVMRGMTLIYMSHEAACRRFGFLKYYASTILLEIGLLYVLMGWSFFVPWVPAGIWWFVESLISRDLCYIVGFMFAARAIVLACVGIELRRRWLAR